MLSQKLKLKLLQKLSPQQIQLMKLFQVPTFALEQRIKEELEINPALDEGNETEQENDELDNENIDDKDNDEFDLSDYMDEDDVPNYKLNTRNQNIDSDNKTIPIPDDGKDFQEFLRSQLGFRDLNETEYQCALHIIGNIDDSGYLTREIEAMVDDLAFTQNIYITEERLLELLFIIQEFDPPGIGARNLQECLLIQIKAKEDSSKELKIAERILREYFDEFTKRHYDKIKEELRISSKRLKIVIDEILKLNPKPGSSFSGDSKHTEYIVPDYILRIVDGEIELSLNSRNAPELRLNKRYMEMLNDYAVSTKKKNKTQKDTILFIKQKIDSARWFIDAIKQRQQTLISVMAAIIELQEEYFLSGDESVIKPMALKDIALKIEMDVSTISRVTSNKYVQTPYGTFLLREFFSESMTTEDGEVSTKEVKMFLKKLIDEENKKDPLKDNQLLEILEKEGYHLARRTVAKYREQLNIPVARLRREL